MRFPGSPFGIDESRNPPGGTLIADRSSGRYVGSEHHTGLTECTAVALPEQGPYAGRGVIERMRVVGIEVDQVLEEA